MTQIEVGSLFAGIGGFDLAAERAGFRLAWHSEIDRYSSRVLKYRWPNIENLGDINEIQAPPWCDILVGGFPCQSYSVAGNRGGLFDDRGALWWQYHRLIGQIRPTWVVGENVPGLLSSAGGRDFETIVGSLADLGYGVVWAVLDSQYFGVAQRRRRVFIVGHSGGRPRPEILALSEGMFGHPEPRREAQQDIAAPLETRATADRLRAEQGHIIGFSVAATDPVNLEGRVPTISGRNGDQGGVVYSPDAVTALRARDSKGPAMDVSEPSVIAFAQNQRAEVRDLNDVAGSLAAQPGMKQQTYIAVGEIASTLQTKRRDSPDDIDRYLYSEDDIAVRRLTPLECERLQGFPDGWTDIPKNSDTQRYKQLGNAVTVNTVQWIMERIAATYPDLYIHPKTDR